MLKQETLFSVIVGHHKAYLDINNMTIYEQLVELLRGRKNELFQQKTLETRYVEFTTQNLKVFYYQTIVIIDIIKV